MCTQEISIHLLAFNPGLVLHVHVTALFTTSEN